MRLLGWTSIVLRQGKARMFGDKEKKNRSPPLGLVIHFTGKQPKQHQPDPRSDQQDQQFGRQQHR